MRISKISLDIEITNSLGLKPINLTKKPLGPLVALVGKNGAGKSRILQLIKSYFNYFSQENLFDGHISEWPKGFLSKYIEQIDTYKIQVKNFEGAENKLRQDQLIQTRNSIAQKLIKEFARIGKAYFKVVDNDALKIIKEKIAENAPYSFGNLMNNTYSSIDINSDHFNPRMLNNQQLETITLNEFETFNTLDTIDYLNDLALELITDEFNLFLQHKNKPDQVQKELENKQSFKLFSIFQLYVKQFLGKEITYESETKGKNIKTILLFDGKKFDINLFSPGQKTLFAYAVLFFYLDNSTKTRIRDSIIIIDEPEKHLHPEAQILLIDAIKKIVAKSGQLWIATHSINILSHLDYDEILLIKDGEIIPPSRTTPGNSFSDLMGIEDHISELSTFVSSVSDWAFANFVIQCLKDPEVIFDVNINDPQFMILKKIVSNNTITKLLDFGAGKGRVGYTIFEDEVTRDKFSYFAFEPDKKNYSYLYKVPGLKKLYEKVEDMPSDYFECVLLCGVLHEINPMDWINTLTSIKRVLKQNGVLIVLEDRFLPKGENSNEFGYLILDEKQLQTLLNLNSSSYMKLKESNYNSRIIFLATGKEDFEPNVETLEKSIKLLKTDTISKIKEYKRNHNDLDGGRKLANLTQLFVNSYLFLESLKQIKNNSNTDEISSVVSLN